MIAGDDKTTCEIPVNGNAPSRSHVYFLAVVFEGGLVLLWIIAGQWLEMPPHEQGHLSAEAFLLGAAAKNPTSFTWEKQPHAF